MKISSRQLEELIRRVVKEILSETTVTGNIAGYSTPYAFTGKSNKKRKDEFDRMVAQRLGWELIDTVNASSDDLDEAEITVVDDLIESWSPKNIRDGAQNGELLDSPLGKIKIDKKENMRYRVKVGGRQFVGTDINAAEWLNSELGITEGRRGRYHDYRDDKNFNAAQKIGRSLRDVRDTLKEIEKIVDINLRFKNELEIQPSSYWKRTRTALGRIRGSLSRISEKVREFEKENIVGGKLT